MKKPRTLEEVVDDEADDGTVEEGLLTGERLGVNLLLELGVLLIHLARQLDLVSLLVGGPVVLLRGRRVTLALDPDNVLGRALPDAEHLPALPQALDKRHLDADPLAPDEFLRPVDALFPLGALAALEEPQRAHAQPAGALGVAAAHALAVPVRLPLARHDPVGRVRRVHGDGGGEGARHEERRRLREGVRDRRVPQEERLGEAAHGEAVQLGDVGWDRVVRERLGAGRGWCARTEVGGQHDLSQTLTARRSQHREGGQGTHRCGKHELA